MSKQFLQSESWIITQGHRTPMLGIFISSDNLRGSMYAHAGSGDGHG